MMEAAAAAMNPEMDRPQLLDLPVHPRMPALVYAPIPPPEPEVIPDPPPVLQPRPDGGLQNVKERVYVFMNRYLKISPKYSTTHDGVLHRVSLTISGNKC
jgi:hypothetical protein